MKKKLPFEARYLTVIILILPVFAFFGCVTQKNVPLEKMSKTPNWKNLYFFHAEDSTWIVKPFPSAGNQFSGTIYKPEEIRKNRQVHIYADRLSSVKINDDKLSVPMQNIVKVENYKITAGTIIAIAVILGLLFLIPVYL